jgi:hypothetical protein
MARAPETASAAGTVTVVAGGVGGPGPGTSVALHACGVTVAGDALYVGNHVDVRRVSTAAGSLTTVAGNGSVNAGRNGASAAQFAFSGQACDTAVDKSGNLVVMAAGLYVVAARTGVFYAQSMTAGHVYAIKPRGGNTASGYPVGVALDQAGNIVVADTGSPACGEDCPSQGAQVLVVATRTGSFYGRKMTAGRVYTVAGVLAGPVREGNTGLAVDAWLGTTIGPVRLDRAGNLVVPDGGESDYAATIAPSVRVVAVRTGVFYGQKMTAGHIYRVAGNGHVGSGGDGGRATKAPLNLAGEVAADSTGNLVILDGSRVRVVAVRTGRFYGQRMTAGDIYGIAGAGAAGFSGDGAPAGKARIDASAVAVDRSGNVVLGCGYRVRVVAAKSGTFYGRRMTAGDIYTVAGTGFPDSGDGGPPAEADFSAIIGTAEDPSGDLAFADSDSLIWVVMARRSSVYGRMLAAGDSYKIGGNGNGEGYSGDGGPAAKASFSLTDGAGVTFDHAGNAVVADAGNERVRVIAARTGTFYGQRMIAGYVYTIAGTGPGRSCDDGGDGGLATKATLCDPQAVSADHVGNLLVTAVGGRLVRVVAARTGTFYGREMTVGDIYTIAGDGTYKFTGDGVPATKAGLSPFDAVADPAGNVIIADADGNQRVRLVAASTGTFYGQKMTAGDIYTIAGDGTYGFSGKGNGGPALDAELAAPSAVAVDRSGNVVFADQGADVVWVVAASTGMFYGLPMTAGDIYIVAGHGSNLGNDGLGDGGPALGSSLDEPDGVAISPAGDLLVGDEYDNRVRAISS